MARVALCYEIANRLFHDNRYTIIKFPSKEIYDPLVYRQEYWVDDQIFAAREKKVMILYRFLLFRPWARLGFWVLKKYLAISQTMTGRERKKLYEKNGVLTSRTPYFIFRNECKICSTFWPRSTPHNPPRCAGISLFGMALSQFPYLQSKDHSFYPLFYR